MRDLRIAVAAAAFSAAMVWPSPGIPASRSTDAPARRALDLPILLDVDQALRQALRSEEQRLVSGCDFDAIRRRLLEIGAGVGDAIEQLHEFHREGRFRSSGLAMSEVLVQRLAALREEARRDAALAEVLGGLHRQALDGSHDARDKLGRIVAAHPAPPACLTRELDERLRNAAEGAAAGRQPPRRD
jgi:hypothetical protein